MSSSEGNFEVIHLVLRLDQERLKFSGGYILYMKKDSSIEKLIVHDDNYHRINMRKDHKPSAVQVGLNKKGSPIFNKASIRKEDIRYIS